MYNPHNLSAYKDVEIIPTFLAFFVLSKATAIFSTNKKVLSDILNNKPIATTSAYNSSAVLTEKRMSFYTENSHNGGGILSTVQNITKVTFSLLDEVDVQEHTIIYNKAKQLLSPYRDALGISITQRFIPYTSMSNQLSEIEYMVIYNPANRDLKEDLILLKTLLRVYGEVQWQG